MDENKIVANDELVQRNDEFVPAEEPVVDTAPEAILQNAENGDEVPTGASEPTEESAAPVKKRATRKKVKPPVEEQTEVAADPAEGKGAEEPDAGIKANEVDELLSEYASSDEGEDDGFGDLSDIAEQVMNEERQRAIEETEYDDTADMPEVREAAETRNYSVANGRVVVRNGSKHRISAVPDGVGFSMSENFARIQDKRRARAICDATIAQVSTAKALDYSEDCVVVNYLGFNVLIPMSRFFSREEDAAFMRSYKANTSGRIPEAVYLSRRHRDIARRMIGSDVQFLIEVADEKLDRTQRTSTGDFRAVYRIIGDRQKALENIRYLNFFSPLARRSPVRVGDIVDCRVLATTTHGVRVMSCGLTLTIGREDLSVTRWCVPDEDFYPGMEFKAVVSSCEIDYENQSVSMELSRRLLPAEKEAAEFYLGQLNTRAVRGSQFFGTIAIISRDASGAPRFYGINLDTPPVRALVPLKSNLYQHLTVGQTVVFRATSIDMNSYIMLGTCEPVRLRDRRIW